MDSPRHAIRDISACRTPALGGTLYACPHCHDSSRYSYHSCGNRACPKCGNHHTSQWLTRQRALLIPSTYLFVTFTLPRECRAVARAHQKSVYSAFFRAATYALLSLARDPTYLGGTPGILGILQTWRSDLRYHVHIHFIVTARALSPRHDRWIPHRYHDWLLPHKALAARVKLRFKAELASLRLLHLVHPRVWSRRFSWVVDCRPAGSGEEVLKYLAPYVFRIAISNNRISSIDTDQVSFRVKDRPSASWTSLSLPALVFISRFLHHVLPQGFVKVRYFGLFAPTLRASLLPLAQALLPLGAALSAGSSAPPSVPPAPPQHRCPSCGTLMTHPEVSDADDVVFAAIERRSSEIKRQRHGHRILTHPVWAAAAAVVLVALSTLVISPIRQMVWDHDQLSLATDMDRNGTTDIVDAYLLALAVRGERPTSNLWDLTGDEVVDDADVRAVARMAVSVGRSST